MPTGDPLISAVVDLSFARDLQTLTPIVKRAARQLTAADGVTLVLRDRDQCYYADEDAIEPLWKGRRFPMETCVSGWVMKNACPLVLPDVFADGRVPHDVYRKTFVRSLAMVPVRQEQPIGAIGAYWRDTHEASEAELRVLQALANATALALGQVELYQDLQRSLEGERQARLAAEEANRAKDEFLATLSHELRTPLNVITGWVWQLRQPGVDADTVRKAAEVIERNTALQTRLVEDLLDASRAAAGKLKLNSRLVELEGLCRIVVDLAKAPARAKDVRVELVDSAPCMVWGDPDRLQQIVWNIVHNAVKFTPEGGKVEVSVGRGERQIQIEVRDTGAGIEPGLLPHVFDRFRQGDSSTTRQHGGLGLGLAITRQLVELHGGEVRAWSDGPGRGTRVTVDLPVPALLEEPGSWLMRRAGSESDGPRLDGLTVMVVDDEGEACEGLARILEMHGAAVQRARSAAEALLRIESDPPDVLLTDIAMPGMDGFDLMRHVRASPSEAARVPAAALTAFSGTSYEETAKEAGFQTFITKPIAPGELASAVARLAERRRGH